MYIYLVINENKTRPCITSFHCLTIVTNYWLTKCKTVFTTSLLVTCPTSTSPMSTPNFKLSVVAIDTTWSGLLMSPNAIGSIGSSIGDAVCMAGRHRRTPTSSTTDSTRVHYR